jgi:cytochrome c oxidase subunit 2
MARLLGAGLSGTLPLLVAPGAALAAGAAEASGSTSIFAPASTPAIVIRDLSWLVLAITVAIFVVVAGLLTYSIVRYRQRPGDERREPPQIYGSAPIELAWTVVPLLIVVVLFLVTARTIVALDWTSPPAGALRVTAIGHQWWWEFRYPDLGIVTANELHVPVGGPGDGKAVFLTLESADVIHSFWVPRLAGKTDLIPNRQNRMWVEPLAPGTYVGQCAEYCGTQHAKMLLRVVAHPRDAFERWVAAQRAPPAEDPSVRAGRALFEATACVNCHTVRGTVANGRFGPDLTHLMSRETIGAGAAANTPASLRAWVENPARLKPGALMPAMNLRADDLDRIVAYLATLK